MSNTELNPEDLTIAEGESYTEWLTEMADTIRAKLGTDEPIKPVAFPTKMRQIASGNALFKASNNVNDKQFELNFIPAYVGSYYGGIISSGGFVSVSNSSVHNYLTGDVSFISGYGFYSMALTTDVSFKNCKSVGNRAFYGNTNLRTAYFPECEEFDYLAFQRVSNLASIYAPNCRIISWGAFGGVFTNYVGDTSTVSSMRLVNADLGSPEIIDYGAFYWQSLMTSGLNFENTKSIGGSAFYSCTLFNVPVDAPVCSFVGNYAFMQTHDVSYAYLPNLVDSTWISRYGYSQSYTFQPLAYTFYHTYGLEFAYINFPDKLSTYACNNTFGSCYNMKNVVLRNIANVGSNLFNGCSNLRSIFIWNDDPSGYTSGNGWFPNTLTNVVVPDFAYSLQSRYVTSSRLISMPEAEFKARVKELVDEYRGVDTPIWGEDDGSETTS